MSRWIELTDDSGDELTSGNDTGVNPGLYKFEQVAGVDTDYAYLGVSGNLSLRIESINIYLVSGSLPTLSGEIQYYGEGATWITKTSSAFSYVGADAKTYNVISLNEVIDGTPMRIKLSTTNVVNTKVVYIKVLKK